ncbi:hypothetical protein EDD18DRAFT_1462296 [Armillaria luteobubalina]|uniref:Peptidase C14 caspase domain-containing protein n=1 Tax=Armillaria luteobubalina TaxID=153913 RepID=A0AA39UU67_9AGAR|nr:hypothetical protein EDD18DRAFT_1462296 [Armillaria luteobubalina]
MSPSPNNTLTEEYTKASPFGKVDGNRFWAIVIGIDAYETETMLHGCVSDATNSWLYMSTNLGVPPSHIKLLLGIDDTTPQKLLRRRGMNSIPATRANIVNMLLNLSTNTQIQHDDNIVIYFSGHGASYRCKSHPAYKGDLVANIGSIEALCPMDHNPRPIAGDVVKPVIPDISDREVSTILTEVCRTKGHHITVILDCCFSSGATRIPMKGEGVPCMAKELDESDTLISEMFAAAETRLGELKADDGSPRYRSISAGDWEPDEGTHVALAACNAYELAVEVKGEVTQYGVFTKVLL